MATMKEVAQRAEVSVSTVSHVINETRFVSIDVRSRVLAVIAELDYIPSAVARSLKHQRTRIIGMMTPNNSNPYFAEITRGIEDACFEAGFNVILCNSDDDPRKQTSYIRVLMEKQVDGLIITPSGANEDLGDLLSSARKPLLILDREVENIEADFVTVDHELGGYLATNHLIELGHRHIACIAGPSQLSPAIQRLAGYRRALSNANLPLDPNNVVTSNFTSASGYTAMQRLLSMNPRPTAVFACNDLIALGAICAATNAGLSLPKDLSIVGFDDIELAAFTSPPLTTMAQPKYQLGALAAGMLIDRIARKHEQPQRKTLRPELRIRQSTGAPFRAS